MEAILHDKKGSGDVISTVYVPAIGTYEFRNRTKEELRTDLRHLAELIG